MTNDKKIQSEFEIAHPCPSRRTLTTWEGFQEGWQAALATRPDVNQELVEALERAREHIAAITQCHPTLSAGDKVIAILIDTALAKYKDGESAGFTEEELIEIALVGIAKIQGREHELDDSSHVANYRKDALGAINALKQCGALRVKGEVI